MGDLVFNLPSTIFLLAIVYGLIFASVLILRSKRKKNAHFWLGVFLFVFSFCLIDTYLKLIRLDELFPPINWTYYRLLTLIPYTLWIYVSHLITGKFSIGGFEKLLLGCLGIELAFRVYAFVIAAMGWEVWAQYNVMVVDTWLETIIISMALLTMIKSLQLIRAYQKKLENNYSERTEKDLKWLKELLSVLFVVTLLWMLVVPIDFLLEGIYIPGYLILVPQALTVFYFGIKGHLQPEIFHEFALVSAFKHNRVILADSGNRKKNHAVDQPLNRLDTPSEQILRIEQLVHEEKIYRQPKLTLQDMAERLKMSTRQLSKLINQNYQCSFSDFINQYRVEEVKKKILAGEDEKLTLLAIAFDAGFNSKSSFHYMFKKIAGMTPMQFKGAIKS